MLAIAGQQGLAAKAGEIIGEVGKLGIGEAAYRFRHGSLRANAGSRLILLERFDQIGLVLTCQSRHLLAARIVGIVAGTANAFVRQLGTAAIAGLVGGSAARRRWRRQTGDIFGNGGKLGVAHVFGDGVHLGIGTPAFTIEEQLVHDEQLGLSADRRHIGILRLAALAMTGGAGGDLVLQSLG